MTSFHDLQLYDEEDYEEVELDDSIYNPANDEFRRVTQSLLRDMRHTAAKMLPRHAIVAKMSLSGLSNVDIAKKTHMHPQTVGKILKSDDAKRLKGLLIEYRNINQGVTAIQRESLLWRIALSNEELDPKTSISAIAEINRMKVDTDAAQAKIEERKNSTSTGEQPQVIIQLADPRLKPTALDAPNPNIKDVN